MKIILFDLAATQPNSNGKRHGGGVYGEVVFSRILERGLHVEAFYDSSKWFNPEIERIVRECSIKLHDIHKAYLQNIIDNNKIDILYTPLIENYIRGIRNCKIKATIHGLRILEVPQDWEMFNYQKERSIKRFLGFLMHLILPIKKRKRLIRGVEWKLTSGYDIMTVSNHSAYSIKTLFPSLRDKEIKIFYSPLLYGNSQKKRHSDTKYFLLVSANRWEKNNLRAIKALDKLFSENSLKEYRVLITGADTSDIFRYTIKNKEKFIFKGYVSDDELEDLYANAYCLIYPSLNEGFGYPPLESMRFGNPVLASSFASISEVCGDAVIYFNPFSVEEIANRVLMITNKDIYDDMCSRALHRFKVIADKQRADLDNMIDYIFDINEK